MIEAVIFDIDGTLIDSVALHARAWQDAFAHFGHRISYEDIRRQIGKGGDQLMPVFLPAGELERIQDELETYRGDLFKRHYLPRVRPFSEIPTLFQRIREDGKRIALASSAKQDELKTYKTLAEIDGLVEEESSADDAARSKPHPDVFEAVLERLGKPDPSRVLVVGDTPYDAEAAGKAGLRTLGVLTGGWTEAELCAAGCVAVFRGPADLLAKYDESPIRKG